MRPVPFLLLLVALGCGEALAPSSALTGGGFTKVHGVTRVGVAAHGNDKYLMSFVPGSSYDPATGKLKVRNALTVTTGTPGSLDEVASTTDLSGVTFVLEVIGL